MITLLLWISVVTFLVSFVMAVLSSGRMLRVGADGVWHLDLVLHRVPAVGWVDGGVSDFWIITRSWS